MYKVLLWIHVFTAIALLGPTFLAPVVARMRGNPPSPQILQVEAAMQRYGTIFVVVALLSGGWLIGLSPFTKDRFGEARWLHLGMLLYFIAAGLVTGYIGPRLKKARAAVDRGDGGEANQLLEPVDKVVGPVVGVFVAVIVYLMVNKPF